LASAGGGCTIQQAQGCVTFAITDTLVVNNLLLVLVDWGIQFQWVSVTDR